MATITKYREIPLDDLVIGKGQVRVRDVAKGLDDLVDSIRTQGLLQPIVVCPAREPRKWEILTGQRRFLAHKQLKEDRIAAAVLDERVDESEAKAISITENLVRRKLTGQELKDGIFHLYNRYGTIRDVVSKTGLPRDKVRDYVKYPRLITALKKFVDEGRVDVNAAVRAQDASEDASGNIDEAMATTLALEMDGMSDAQRRRVTKDRKENPDRPVDEVVERAKSPAKITQIIVTVTKDVRDAIEKVAAEAESSQDQAAVALIEEALTARGLIEY